MTIESLQILQDPQHLSFQLFMHLVTNGPLFSTLKSPVYTTEIFWHGSGEIGTGPKKKGSARIKFAV